MKSLTRSRIYDDLRDDIVRCRVKPGTLLLEKELADRLGVSRSPIRDALLKLEEHGFIDVVPRRGYRVRPISISDARELYQLRHILERECLLGTIDTASDETLLKLDRFREPVEPLTFENWMDQNSLFHRFFAENCGNRRLCDFAIGILDHFERLTLMGISSKGSPMLEDFVAEHREIIDAVQARNRRKAAALVRDHIDASGARIVKLLEQAAIQA